MNDLNGAAGGPEGLAGQPEEESQLENLWRAVRERWWLVLAAVLLCFAIMLGLALTSQKQYEATSSLLFRDPGLSSAVAGATLFEASPDPQRDTATNVELVRSTVVADQVIEALGLDTAAEDLLDDVTIAAEENADIVSITARDTDPDEAAAIANSFAEEYVSYRRQADREKVQQGQRLVRQRIAELPPGASAERSDLENALRSLILLESVQTGNAEVTDVAIPPDSPASPKPVRDGVLGILFGLVLGVSLVLLLDLLDRRVKSVEDFERRYGLRTLATVPAWAFTPSGRDAPAAVEPYRILRSAVDYRSSWEPTRTLLITSAGPGEGKTSVAVNLARAVAAGNQTVILVEADLRRPSFGDHFDELGPTGGLSTALTREVPLEGMLAPTAMPLLRVLPSGPPPPNPSELIRRARMGEVLEGLARLADLVIVDSPPLLPVADTHSMLALPQVDAFIVVARAFQTTRQEISRTRKLLAQQSMEPLGLVICGTKERIDYYGAYRPRRDAAAAVEPDADAAVEPDAESEIYRAEPSD